MAGLLVAQLDALRQRHLLGGGQEGVHTDLLVVLPNAVDTRRSVRHLVGLEVVDEVNPQRFKVLANRGEVVLGQGFVRVIEHEVDRLHGDATILKTLRHHRTEASDDVCGCIDHRGGRPATPRPTARASQ